MISERSKRCKLKSEIQEEMHPRARLGPRRDRRTTMPPPRHYRQRL